MWEIIKAFHEAVRTDSSLPFIAIVALFAGMVAWAIDVGYKRNAAAAAETAQPIVDFDFRPNSSPPTVFVKITDRGEFQLRSVEMEATEYKLEHRKVITQMNKIGGVAQLSKQIGSRGGESKPFDLHEIMPPLQFEQLADRGPSSPVPTNERFYALRFSFLHGGKKRFCFYKVISATAPYVLLDESSSAWGYSGSAQIPIALAKDWITSPRKVILDDQRSIPWPDNAEEYEPGRRRASPETP